MLHIAVCDDDIKILGEVKQILTDYCKAKKLAFKISAYCDGTDLLKCLNPQLCWGELSKTYRV